MKNINKKWFCVVLVLMALVCIGGRFALLGISYEYDELFTAVSTNPALSWSMLLERFLAPDVHPPFYNWLVWLSNHVLPYGPEVYLRLPSLVFGLLSLVLAWFCFPKRWGKTARLVFFAFLACHFYSVFMAQYARAYTLLLCWSIPFTFLFLDLSRATAKGGTILPRRWLMLGALALGLSWTHYFGALFMGVCFLVLFAQAVYYKRSWCPYLLTPLCVLLLFSPWLVPNLLVNINQSRFSGNWWGNERESLYQTNEILYFFFSSFEGHSCMVLLLAAAIGYSLYRARRGHMLPYKREILLLSTGITLTFVLASLVSLKINLMVGRYFIELIPAVYLLITLLFLPLLRSRQPWMRLGVCLFVGLTVWSGYEHYRMLKYTPRFPARASAQMLTTLYPGKNLFVVAMEAFPPASMEPMYSFYPNHIYHMGIEVRELYQLDETARNTLLAQRENAVLWMPTCPLEKLERLSKEWDRLIAVEHILGSACFLQMTEEGAIVPDKNWRQ